MVGPEGEVIGVHPDKERIQLAMETHSRIENLSFVEGSALNFPGIGSGSYNIIFSNFALHWMTNKQQVFNNMFESLEAGGKIAFQYVFMPPFVMSSASVGKIATVHFSVIFFSSLMILNQREVK